jgi:sec-independent protein translocase protein TatA
MEIAVIAIIALIVLGPNKLPEAARSLGKGFREMRDSFQGAADGEDHDFSLADYDEDDDETTAADDDEPKAEAATAEASPAGEDHQNEARSSVPSASSSSTERE